MKRILLSVLLISMVAFYGYSQSLSLITPQGVNVTNTTITQFGTYDSVELITYLNVKNISSNTINVYSKKVDVKLLDSTETTMCWAGGCYPSFVTVSPNSAPMTPGQTLTDFVGHYSTTTGMGFKLGESVVRWVFFNGANHNDSAYLLVKYKSWTVGLDEKASREGFLSSAYPNPANASASFNCSVPAGLTGTIVVRNMVGATVLTESIAPGAATRTINTSGLADGLYFYSLVLDGKNSITKKLIVKH
ncbi:MAG: T9SS type A sorting domain-containing protein [Bacteroidota bacterium]